MEFKPIKNNRVYEQVIEQIKDLIERGQLKKGDKLPSERELKNQLDIGRSSIREAFSALEMIGLIESRPGEGTFIRDNSAERRLLEPLSLLLLLEENVTGELVELRRVLEVDCVRLAAERRTEDDLRELEQYIEELAGSSGYEEESVRADRLFHYTIARASGNKVLRQVMVSISEAMDFHIKYTRTRLVSRESTMNNFVIQHRRIFSAIREGVPEKAMSAMGEHLGYVEKLIGKEIQG